MSLTEFDHKACARVRSYLDSYLSGELLVETNHDIQRHLAECRNCAGEVEARARMTNLLRRVTTQETAPAALRERIWEMIRASQPAALFPLSRGSMMLAT